MEHNIRPLWAEEILRERGGSLDSLDLYNLTLLATGDEGVASRARTKKMHEEMANGEKPRAR